MSSSSGGGQSQSRTGLLTSGPTRTLLLGVLLVLVTVVLYRPVHHFAFIDIDDPLYVTGDPHVTGVFSLATLKWAFTHPYVLNYDPLTFLAHHLNVQMFQLQAGRHHDVNVVLHILNALLLFWVFRRATGYTGRSFMVAALFAWHPIQVENVAWIAELKTVLSSIFFFLALGAYRWYARAPRLRRMAVVALVFGLGLLAKPQIITLPFVLLLWDYWPLRRMFPAPPDPSTVSQATFPAGSFGSLVKEKIPLFAIAAVDAILTLISEHKNPLQFPYPIRLGNAILSYARYLRKAVWPSDLSLMYPHPGYSLPWGQVWAALLLLLLITAVVLSARRHRYLAVGWLWFLGTMVPTIGLVQVDVSGMADRYAYLPFIGLFLMLCWGVAEWSQQRHVPRPALAAASLALLLVLGMTTRRQVGYWRDSLTVWTHTLNSTYPNYVADYRLAALFRHQGQFDKAMAYLQHAREQRPKDYEINLQMALLEQQRGNLTLAIEGYQQVLTGPISEEDKRVVWTNLAHAYTGLGDNARAAEYYRAASQPVPPQAVDWSGDWWRDLGPYLRKRFQEWRSGQAASSEPGTLVRLLVGLDDLGVSGGFQFEDVAGDLLVELDVTVLGEPVIARRLQKFLLYADPSRGIDP